MVSLNSFTVCEVHEQHNCGCINAEEYEVVLGSCFDE